MYRRPAPLFDPLYAPSGPPTQPLPALDALLGPMLQVPSSSGPSMRRRSTRRRTGAGVFFSTVPLLLAVLLLAHWSGFGFGADDTVRIAPSTPLERCEADLRAEHARWLRDPSVAIDPSSCDQPGVSYADYVRLFEAAGGGTTWYGTPTTAPVP